MPYQPTFPSPYLTSVDVTKDDCMIKCLINPRDIIVGYIACISRDDDVIIGWFKNTPINTVTKDPAEGFHKCVYVGSKISPLMSDYKDIETPDSDVDLPIYGADDESGWFYVSIPDEIKEVMSNGINYKWRIYFIYEKYPHKICETVFSQDVENSYILYIDDSNCEGLVEEGNRYLGRIWLKYNGEFYWLYIQSDTYAYVYTDTTKSTTVKLTISEGEKCEIYTDILKTPDYFFYTQTEPTVSFIDPPLTVNGINQTFKASYFQQEDIPFSYYRFKLYLGDKLIDDTDKVYSSLIKYTYDKFASENTYTLVLDVEDECGNTASISHTFYVQYSDNVALLNPEVSTDRQTCISLDYSTLSIIDGVSKKIEYIDIDSDGHTDMLSINNNGYVYWNKTNGNKSIKIPYDSTIIYKQHFHTGFRGDVCAIYDESNVFDKIIIWFNGEQFVWENGLNDEQYISVYENTESAIIKEGNSVEVLDNTRYIIDSENTEDTIEAGDTIIANDTLNKYWWYIVIRPRTTNQSDVVKIIKGEAY